MMADSKMLTVPPKSGAGPKGRSPSLVGWVRGAVRVFPAARKNTTCKGSIVANSGEKVLKASSE